MAYSSKIIFGLIVLVFLTGNSGFAQGEELNLDFQPSLNFNPLDNLNSAGVVPNISTGGLLEGFKFNLPFDISNLNIDTNVPMSPKANESQQSFPDINLKQFLTPKDLSSDDLGGAIKAVVALIIEIFLVVISIAAQILKLVLEFLR